MIADMFRSEDYASENDAEDRAHAALFAHVGVKDPADWRAVALALAERYAPQVLTGEAPTAPTRRKAGRPETRDILAKGVLLSAIDELQVDAREGRIKSNLSTIEAACDFLLNDPQAASLRERCRFLGMEINTTVDNLKNLVSMARKEQPDRHAKITET